jgi:hypothetical protein
MFKNGTNLNTFIGLLKNLIAYKLDKCTFMGMHDDFIGTMGHKQKATKINIIATFADTILKIIQSSPSPKYNCKLC